jgi:hypothetical protein
MLGFHTLRTSGMAAKEAQINLRLPAELDAWLETQAGGKRKKPAYIRHLIERARAREEEEELRTMFDRAWESLSAEERAEERAERERWFGAYAGHEGG